MTRYYGYVEIRQWVEAASEEEARQMLRDQMRKMIAEDDDVLEVHPEGERERADWDWVRKWLRSGSV